MAKFKYVGPLAGEYLPTLDVDVMKNETVDVEDEDLIAGLSRNRNWKRVEAKKGNDEHGA